jgi:hypothetical protein
MRANLQKCKDAKLKAVRDWYSVLGSLVAINKIVLLLGCFFYGKCSSYSNLVSI